MANRNCDYTTREFGYRCKGGKVSKTVRIKYKPKEEDVFYLCDKCAENTVKEAEKKQWQITVRDFGCSPSKK